MLDDPLLYFLNAIVVFFKNLTNGAQFQPVFGSLLPWKLKHQLKIGPEDLVVGRGGWYLRQSSELPLHLLSHMVGKIGVLDFLLEFSDLVLVSFSLAEFLVDRFQLFTQNIFPLRFPDLGLRIAGDLLSQL